MIINYNLFKKVLSTNRAFSLSGSIAWEGFDFGEGLFSKDFFEAVGAQEFIVALGCVVVRFIKDIHADFYSVFITACKGCWYVFLGNIGIELLIDAITVITDVSSSIAYYFKKKSLPKIAKQLETLGCHITANDLYGAEVSWPQFTLQREEEKRTKVLVTRTMSINDITFIQEHILGSRKYKITREGYSEVLPDKVKKLS